MAERAWLHTTVLWGVAVPVVVLTRGPRRARVRLLHMMSRGRRTLPAGSTLYVHPSRLETKPRRGVMVSVGGCQYVQQNSPRGKKAVARG
jgi:hypothetical protein